MTDISRFFLTIYTHSIPWALHGKDVSKANRNVKTAAFFGNLLDARSRNVQDGQTIGLPIGPDTSHVIAEIIGTAIDRVLREALGGWPAGFRYVDDFYLFFNDRAEAERALAVVTRAVAQFELEINSSKTRIIETKELIEESWKYKIKGANFADAHIAQRGDIHKFFEDLIALEKAYRDESVVKYGLKIASSSIIKRQNWQVFEAYLLHCGFAYPNSLQTIASLLATYGRYDYPLDRKSIARFCNHTVQTHAPNEHHSEVAWALWIMLELNLALDARAIEALEQISSSSCLLLAVALQLRTGGPSIPAAKLASYAKPEALFEDGWLLSYEGGRRGWFGPASISAIKDDAFFGELLKLGVGFFDEDARLPAIFTPKDARGRAPGIFESDEAVGELFEFEDADEEYFDHDADEAKADEDEEELDPPVEFDDADEEDDLFK